MKTTIEIPASAFRRAKTLAAAKGITLKKLFNEALEEKLRRPGTARHPGAPPWMKGFGALSDLRSESDRIMELIDTEFEQIEPEQEG
jgi:hypothetical protein